MSLKDKIKVLVKSPFFWIVVVIGFIGISILIVSMVQGGKDKCPPGTSRGQCGDKCVPTCPSGKYDCSTNKCVCLGDQKMCNGECCPDKECIEGLCCSIDRQCPIGPGGINECCSNGEICDTNNTCVATCAIKDANVCKRDESCLTVTIKDTLLQEKFLQQFPEGHCGKNNNICSACVPKSECEFGDDKYSPAALTEDGHTKINYYPCTNIINGIDGNNIIGYCTSDESSAAAYCNAFKNKNACTTADQGCTWRNIFDTEVTADVINGDIANIGSINPKIKYEGNWCGNTGDFLQVRKLIQTDDTVCDLNACWDELNKHSNVIDINWDEKGKVCTSVAYCDTGTPEGFSSPCEAGAEPSICKDSDYTCATTGEITKSVPDECTPYKTCMSVVTSSKESGIGWCINEISAGVYEQSCALSKDACTLKGDGAIFVQSEYMCPYSTKPGSAGGCGPNYSLLWDVATNEFKCDIQDPAMWPVDSYCGGLAWSVRTVVWNRTRWPIIITPLVCSPGKTCDDFQTTIEPYDAKEYHAGSNNEGFNSPACSFSAAWTPWDPNPNFDYYNIAFDMHHSSHLSGVTHYGLEGDFFKSVKVTYKMWTDKDTERALFFVIFYPAWEIPDPNDAAITS